MTDAEILAFAKECIAGHNENVKHLSEASALLERWNKLSGPTCEELQTDTWAFLSRAPAPPAEPFPPWDTESPGRCSECDPSFGCFNGSAPCCKAPPAEPSVYHSRPHSDVFYRQPPTPPAEPKPWACTSCKLSPCVCAETVAVAPTPTLVERIEEVVREYATNNLSAGDSFHRIRQMVRAARKEPGT